MPYQLLHSYGGRKFSLNNSEIILTIVFSIVLGVAVLVLIMYSVNKCKKRREQYSHHRLETIPYDDTADTYSVPDDTLVISGGLYDVPRVYNPTVSTLEDDNVLDYLHFTSRPGNFRLEFLPEETEKEPSYMRTNFETFA
ncbi:uncharacterized protein LOC122806215 isoform X2 [Protopterus annectens]|uniref:uncharacterized protein LOC122806215 isoform X2 n=1 Tax=Protopterus annectens TaxID=7888 RepID=UPI001CFBF50C|nr:uncharacterized protein LOC122806215 isoform X2 [Protopterus annectens]XP_043932383.1 uncharacterized protein LOC122806215 isoform X2 [Protopterus annectens]XP_043932384.1 uncharacterized protein LOC122806215 isoform X2 [Protopterus annectens]